jgi:hypothetical protein
MGIALSGGRVRVKATRSARAATNPGGSFSLPRIGRATVAAAVASILYSSAMAAYAADEKPAEEASAPAAIPGQATESLQEVVVTANASQNVKKLDASYSIVSVDAEMLKEANPKSSADLLKVSPGIWPESTGGQTGANIEVEGLPSGGDSPFFTNMIEGLPLYGTPSLSFMDSSSLFRLDDTIERVEVVQGGPGAVFGPAQMGATANYILKTGSADPHGSLAVTYGTEGLYRVDGFYGFPIVPGWYGSIGGFYRDSSGVRDPQFAADLGGQLTGTLKHDLDDGSLMFWARGLSDKNQFITPIPMIQTGPTSFSAYPGFDPLKGTYYSKSIQNVTVPNPAGGFEDADLANGRGGNLYYFGSKYQQHFDGGWNVSNNFLFDGGHLNTNALFSGNNPRPLSYFEYGCGVAQPAGYCNGATATDANNLGPKGQGLSPTLGINATTTGGVPVAADASVIEQGWWYIQKSIQTFVDEARVSKELFEGDTGTIGVYLTHYSDDDNWSLGNQMLMLNRPNTSAVLLNYVQNGHTYNLTSPQGLVNTNGNFNILEHGDGFNTAGYLSDTYKWNRFIFDASARLENVNIHQRTCNQTPEQLGSVYDLYDNATPVCNGTYDYLHYDKTRPVWTAGLNYEILDNMSVYGRINSGVHYDDFDNGIRGSGGNFAPLETMKRYEGGFKFQNRYAYLDLSYWHLQFIGLQYQQTTISGVPIGGISSYGSDSHGLNFVGSITPFQDTALRGLGVRFTGDYMDGHYTHYNGCATYTTITGATACSSPDGEPLQRQPKFQVRVTPNYSMPLWDWGSLTAFVTYEHVGNRYEDIFGLQPLGSYYTLSAGLVGDYGDHYELRVQGTNLSNQLGLTEGNARIAGGNAGIDGVLLARPLEGREVQISAAYKF